MFKNLQENFNYTVKRLFGKDIKIIKGACNRTDMSCCGGGGPKGEPCCKSIFLHVNNYCNSNCFFCVAEKGNREISNFDKLQHVIKELVDNEVASKVVLTGGEPLLHPQFTRFLDILDTYDIMYYSLNTNGTLLPTFIDEIKRSKLKHINISIHHYNDKLNKLIMGNCLTFEDIKDLRKKIPESIEIRLACTITQYLHSEEDIVKYIEAAKNIGVNNVIFRNEYSGFNRYLAAFQKMWGLLYTADICNCGYKLIKGVNAEYRESNTKLKQAICDADLYIRDFIYKDDDILGGSWEYDSQVIY
jgi:organic radical activating enzyme